MGESTLIASTEKVDTVQQLAAVPQTPLGTATHSPANTARRGRRRPGRNLGLPATSA